MTKACNRERILVVDDAIDTLEIIQRCLESHKYKVYTATGVIEANKILESTPIDLVITDVKMPKVSGYDLVRHIRENLKNTEVAVITGYPSIDGVVKAFKFGAEEYLAKPFTDEELLSLVQKVLEKLQMRRSIQSQLKSNKSAPYGIITESLVMQKVINAIEKAATNTATVLITGESGTGKELVARGIHYSSSRGSAPFVPINCGGIPESLLESELFGYVKGAFTGAVESRAGFFQTADGGTIFLDEISETIPAMQIKLLRILQEKEVYMVGSRQPIKVDIRIIAATNKDLQSLVNKNLFRKDLFYRLNVISIEIPPLLERGSDILLLINHFTSKYAKELEKSIPKFSDQVLQILKHYNWPGNIRELENVIQRLVIMNEGDFIDTPELPSLMRFSLNSAPDLNRTLADVEAEHIRGVLASVSGNKTQASRILDVDRKTLREKLKKV